MFWIFIPYRKGRQNRESQHDDILCGRAEKDVRGPARTYQGNSEKQIERKENNDGKKKKLRFPSLNQLEGFIESLGLESMPNTH